MVMINLLVWVGRCAGGLGLLLGIAAVGSRAMGIWRIGDLQVGTLFLGSVAAMARGALAYAAASAERNPR
jgi:hypothetical protein